MAIVLSWIKQSRSATFDRGKWSGSQNYLVRDTTDQAINVYDIASGAVVTVVFDTATDSFRVTEMVASQVASAIQLQAYTAITPNGYSSMIATVSPAISSYTSGLRLRARFSSGGSTLGATLNLNGLGAKALKRYNSVGNKVDAAIVSGLLADIEYDGVDFIVLDALPGASQAGEVQFCWKYGPTRFPEG